MLDRGAWQPERLLPRVLVCGLGAVGSVIVWKNSSSVRVERAEELLLGQVQTPTRTEGYRVGLGAVRKGKRGPRSRFLTVLAGLR